MKKILERDLDAFECTLVGAGNYPSDTIAYRGTLDDPSLSTAYQLLCAKYPTLSARLTNDDQGWRVYVPEARLSEVRITRGNFLELKRELRNLRAQESVTSRLIVVKDGEAGYVSLAVHHALFDYPSYGAIFNDFWDIYTSIVGASPLSIRPNNDIPVSAELLLKQRWLGEPPLEPVRPQAHPSVARHVKHTQIIENTINFDNHDTDRLITMTRKSSVSLHSITCSAILRALLVHAGSVKSARMVCRSAVNLRDRVCPPVGSTETTNFQGLHRADLTVSVDSGVIETARSIKRDLASAISSRGLQMMWDSGKRKLESDLPRHLAQTLVTNVGVVSEPRVPPSLKITDRVVVGWLDGERIAWMAVNPIYLVYTYEGRLRIAGMYPSDYYTSDDVRSVSKSIEGELRSIMN